MHSAAFRYLESIRARWPEYFLKKKVLEIGALDINGTPRPLFTDCDYIGVDCHAGNGVDLVGEFPWLFSRADDFWSSPGPAFDVIISCEHLEHDSDLDASLMAMVELLRPGGLLIITAAGVGRPEHGTPRSDGHHWANEEGYYENVTLLTILEYITEDHFDHIAAEYDGLHQDVRLWARKRKG